MGMDSSWEKLAGSRGGSIMTETGWLVRELYPYLLGLLWYNPPGRQADMYWKITVDPTSVNCICLSINSRLAGIGTANNSWNLIPQCSPSVMAWAVIYILFFQVKLNNRHHHVWRGSWIRGVSNIWLVCQSWGNHKSPQLWNEGCLLCVFFQANLPIASTDLLMPVPVQDAIGFRCPRKTGCKIFQLMHNI